MLLRIFLYSCFSHFLCSAPLFSETKINDIQFLATHNSYKKYMNKDIVAITEAICKLSDFAIDDYQHLPLPDQLARGVRGMELDVYADPQGGRFSEYRFLYMIGEDGKSHDPELETPGFKVMHDVNFDFYSTCHLFTECLSQMLDWSNAHANHLPIFIQIEVKSDELALPGVGNYLKSLDLVMPLPETTGLLDALDQEIRNTIPAHQLITPDQMRGNYATLREAVLANNWPTIADSRGKFIFYMNAIPEIQQLYLVGHPQLNGRVLFTSPDSPSADDAAFLILNGAIDEYQKIKDLVSAGFIVRTRADSGTTEAFNNDYRTWEAALQSGAQIISTDFIVPDFPMTGTDYHVFIPNGDPARCSPMRASFCNASQIAE